MANSFIAAYRKRLADQGLVDETPDILLTEEFGKVVAQESPELFDQYPDFGEEFSQVRNAMAPSLAGEFGRAVVGSTKSLGATAVGAGALLTGSDRLRDVAESIDQSAAQDAPTITSLEDIAPGRSTVGKIFSKDAVRYGVSRLGQAVPSLVEAVGTGLIGAGLGTAAAPGPGTVAGAAAGVVGRQVVKQSIRQLLKKAASEGAESVAEGLVRRGIIREATEEGIEQGLMKGIPEVAEIVSRQARAQAGRLGANTANALNSYLLSAGEIYNETPDRALALGLGALSAIPDTILPARILNRLFPDVAKDEAQDLAKNYVARLAKEALTTVGIEGTTEGFQEAVNLVARNLNADRPVFEFDDDDVKRLREAAIGGVAGGVLAAPSVLTQRSNTVPPPATKPTAPVPPASIITPGAPIIPPAAPVAPAPANISRKVALMSAEQQAQRLAELRQITQLSPLEQQEQQLLTAFVGDQATPEPSAPAPVVQEATVPQAVPETFVAEALSSPVAEDQDFVYTVSDYGTGTKSVQLDLRSQADQNRQGADGQWANNPQSWREVPDVPGWLPQGQYTLAQVKQAITEGPPPATANNPRPVVTAAKVVDPEQETQAQPEIVKKPTALRDLEKALAKDGVEMKVVPYSDNTLHLFHVYVEPVDRKLGKGTNALRQLTAYADSVQQPITLTAIPENKGDEQKLAKLYTGLGFTQTGIEPQTKAAQFRREPTLVQKSAPQGLATRASLNFPMPPSLASASTEEIQNWADTTESFERNMDRQILGDKYEEFRKWDRIANSTTRSFKETNDAQDKVDEIMGSLSESQRALLEGQTGAWPEQYIQAETARGIRQKVADIDLAQDIQQLAQDNSILVQEMLRAAKDGAQLGETSSAMVARLVRRLSQLGGTPQQLVEQMLAYRSQFEGDDVFELSGITPDQFANFMAENTQQTAPPAQPQISSSPVVEAPQLNATPQAPATLLPSATPNVGVPRPFEFGPIIEGPESMDFRSDERVANLTPQQLVQGIPALMKGNLDVSGNRSRTRSAIILQTPDGRMILAGAIMPQNTTNLRGEPVAGNKLSVQRMSAIARQDKKYSKAIYEGGKNSALLSDVIAAGYRPIGYVAFNQKPGTIFQSFANEQHFDQSWGLTDKTTGRLGKRVLHEGQPLTEAIRQTTNISELREVESRIDKIGQELQAAQGTARDELVAEYEQLSARQQQLFDRDQSQTGTDELKYRTSAEAAMYANKAQQFQQAAARLAQLGARVDVFATEVLRQQLPGQPNVTGVQYSPWHIAVGLEDVQNANISNLVTLLHEGVHSLFGRLPLRTQGLILTAAQESMADLRAKAEAARTKTGVPLAELNGNIEELFAETMAQRLAADGVPDGRSMVDALIRWVRDLYYRVTMAVQAAFGKTPDSKTALTWIENQFRRELGGDYEWAFINLLNKLLPESVVGQAQRFAMVGGTPGGIVNFVDPLTLKSVQPEAVSDTTGAIDWNAKYRTDGTPDQEIPGDEARARVEGAAVNEELRAISEIKAQVAPDMAPDSWWATVGRGQSPQTRLDSINQLAEGAAQATIGGERMTDPMNAQAKLKALILLTRMQRQQVNRKAKLDTQVTEASDKLIELAQNVNVIEGNFRDAEMHERTLRQSLKESIRQLVRNNRRGYGMAEINGGLIEAIREAENLSENDVIPEAYQNFLRRFMNTDESLFDELSAIAQLDLSLGTMKIYDVVRAVEAQADSSPILKKLVDDRPRLVALSALARDNAEQLDLIQLGRMRDTERFLEIKAELDQIRQADEQTLAKMLATTDERSKAKGLAQRLRTRYLKRRQALRRTQRFIQRAESQSEVLDKTQQALNPYIADLQSQGVGAHNEWFPVEGAKWTAMSLQPDGSWSRTDRTLEFNADGTGKDPDRTKSDLVENAQWLIQHPEKEGQSFYELVKRQTYELKMLDLKQEYPAQWRHLLDRMIQPLGDEAAAAGHSSGARVKQMLIQWQFILKSHWKGEIEPLSKHWTKELQDVEKSAGIEDHGVFFQQIYDQVMYYLGSEPGLDEQAAIRNATRQARARLVKPPAENFNQQFEQFLRRTKEVNESFLALAERYGVFVNDPRLGANLRKAVAQGWLTNMRSMRGEVLQTIMHDMQNAGWKLEMIEEEKPNGQPSKRVARSTTFDSLTEEQTADADQLRQTLAPLFTPQIVNSWLTPFMNKPGVPVFIYNGRPISQLLLQDAWASSGGDLVQTIDLLSQSVGLEATDENPEPLPAFRLSILKQIDRLYGMEAKLAHDASQTRSLFDPMGPRSHLMMDARLNELIPPEHLQFQVFDPSSARALLGTLAFHSAFGRNGERMISTLNELKSVLSLRRAQWESLKGTSRASRMADASARNYNYKELEKAARNYDDVQGLQQKLETLFGFKNEAGPLGDVRAGLETLGFITGQVVNNPKTGLMNLLGLAERPITQRSLSLDTIAPTARGFAEFSKNVFGSMLETMGLHMMKASTYAKDIGEVEGRAFGRLPWGVAVADIGRGGNNQSTFSDKWLIRPLRGIGAFQRKGLSGPGESREFGRANVVPGIGGVMNYLSQESAVANGVANIQQFETVISRAMKFFAQHPEKMNDPGFRLTAKDLGMHDRAFFGSEGVFDYYRRKAVEYRLGNLEDITKDAMVRQAQGERLLTRDQALGVSMMAANDLNMESSVNTRLAALSNNPILKYGMPLLGWPIEKMNQANRALKTADGQYDAAAVIKGIGRMALWSLPMGIAFSLWMDKYDEKLLKKKSNLASVDWRAGVPIVGPAWALMGSDLPPVQNLLGMLERSARAGNVYGLGADVVTQLVSPALDPTSGQRAVSLDQRVLAFSQFLQVQQAITNYLNQDFEATWASVGRPLVSAMGGSGAMHGVDMFNAALGLDNAQSRIVRRSNVNAWLRSAGRTAGLELKRGDFGGSPTPVTVWVREAQLAMFANDRVGFMEAYRRAVEAARLQGNPDPEKAILASWRSRNPLEVFRSKPTDAQMAQVYRVMDDEGDRSVREAITLFDQYTAMIAPSKFESMMNRRIGQATSAPKATSFSNAPMLIR